MKIAAIHGHVLRTSLDTPFAFSQGWVTERAAVIVEVVTDSGLVGWGEALCVGLQPPDIAAAVIRSVLAPMLLGCDPREPEVLWHRMYNRTRDYGRKGAVVSGISGIDIALWVLCGKARGEPVWRLLGGAFRRRVEAYATGFYRLQGRGEASRLADEALSHYESGLSIMKVKLGFGIEDDLAVMAAIRAALGARPVTLMIDTNHAYGEADAIRLGRALEAYSLRWYEEPVVPENLAGYRNVRRALDIPIAGGECECTVFGFRSVAAAEVARHRPARHRRCRGLYGMQARRRAVSCARHRGEPACLGRGSCAACVAASHREPAGRQSFAVPAGAGVRVRLLVASVPLGARRPSGAA